MRSRRALFSLTLASAVVIAVPVATAIGESVRGPSSDNHINAASAVGSAFTYQGRLMDNGSLPNGTYDIRFVLFDAESGGAQVPNTGIITKDDVTVSSGLFSVVLDFGQAAFNGEARWIELAVKPGGGGTFTVLNPRQPVQPVPQAMYASSAGDVSLPIDSEGESETGGLFRITQTGAGTAFSAVRGYEGATAGSGVSGENAGAGAGVQGSSTYSNGDGVQGSSSGATGTGGSFTGKTGVKATGLDGFSTALEVDGAVKAVGANRFAFIHTSTAQNSFHNITWINSSLTNGDPNAVISITQHLSAQPPFALTPVATTTPVATPTTTPGELTGITGGLEIGIVYIPANGLQGAPGLPADAKGKWAIVSIGGGDFPANLSFSVTVVKQ